jgi:hypothetical protein
MYIISPEQECVMLWSIHNVFLIVQMFGLVLDIVVFSIPIVFNFNILALKLHLYHILVFKS